MERIYLDYAAASPLEPRAREAMEPYFTEEFGNPNSLHSFGQAAHAALDRARETIAGIIGAGFRDVIFTGSASEANNMALRGAVKKFLISNSQFLKGKPKIIISSVEHASVLETARDLEKDGVEVVVLPVDSEGAVDLAALERALDRNTVIVSVMHVNNEIGTIEPLAEIAKVISNWKLGIGNSSPYPLFHTDAAQSLAYLPLDFPAQGVDLATFSGYKVGGPKGIGAVYIKNQSGGNELITPLITGGGHEFGLRAGTPAVPLAIGFAVAAADAAARQNAEVARFLALGSRFVRELMVAVPGIQVNGVPPADRPGKALPTVWNIAFPRHCAKDLLVRFDMAGVAVSAGSACHSGVPEVSHVLHAIGLPEERAKNSVRMSFGHGTTEEGLREAVRRIKRAVTEAP